MRASMLAAAILAGALALGVTGVQAAPGSGPNANTVHADCGDGPSDVTINGHANVFAAAHLAGGGTFVPTSFGETTIIAGGQTFTDPAVTKGGSAHASGTPVTCTYEFTTSDGAQVSGTVTGFITPGG